MHNNVTTIGYCMISLENFMLTLFGTYNSKMNDSYIYQTENLKFFLHVVLLFSHNSTSETITVISSVQKLVDGPNGQPGLKAESIVTNGAPATVNNNENNNSLSRLLSRISPETNAVIVSFQKRYG